MPLDDENLWNWMVNQGNFIYQEFGIGVVGIGALFIAYSSISSLFYKEVIAMIGFGGSFVLFMHMYGSGIELLAFKKEIEKSNPEFIQRFDNASSWRRRGIFRYIYYPTTLLATIFMWFVSLIWLTILLMNMGFDLKILIYIDITIILFTLELAFYVRYKEIEDGSFIKFDRE